MCLRVVMTSGAGVGQLADVAGDLPDPPAADLFLLAHAQVVRSQIAPLPPPSGMSTTAHFQVIHIARARTVSTVSDGSGSLLRGAARIVVLTRKPLKTWTCPSSMRTGSGTGIHAASRQIARAFIEIEQIRDLVELSLRHLERVEALRRHALCSRKMSES